MNIGIFPNYSVIKNVLKKKEKEAKTSNSLSAQKNPLKSIPKCDM